MTTKEKFEKWFKWRDNFTIEDAYTAGHKEGRKEMLEEIYKKIEEINVFNRDTKKINTVYVGAKLAEYIDTELKKMG